MKIYRYIVMTAEVFSVRMFLLFCVRWRGSLIFFSCVFVLVSMFWVMILQEYLALFYITIDIGLRHKSVIFEKFFQFSPQKKRKCNKSVTTECYNSFRTKETTVFLLILTKIKLKSGRKNYTFQSNIKDTISSGYAVWQTLYSRFFHAYKKL